MPNPTIFFIEEDDQNRPEMRLLLKQYNFTVQLAVDEEDAFQRVASGYHQADLILINFVSKFEADALEFGRRIRSKMQLNIPIVVMPKIYEDEMEGKNVQVGENEYLAYFGDNELFDLLITLTKA